MVRLVGVEMQDGINSVAEMGCSEHGGGKWRVEPNQ